jgi:hypothetical protein
VQHFVVVVVLLLHYMLLFDLRLVVMVNFFSYLLFVELRERACQMFPGGAGVSLKYFHNLEI